MIEAITWHPVSELPDYNITVLGFSPNWDGEVTMMWLEEDEWWEAGSGGLLKGDNAPTHWAHLPAGPDGCTDLMLVDSKIVRLLRQYVRGKQRLAELQSPRTTVSLRQRNDEERSAQGIMRAASAEILQRLEQWLQETDRQIAEANLQAVQAMGKPVQES